MKLIVPEQTYYRIGSDGASRQEAIRNKAAETIGKFRLKVEPVEISKGKLVGYYLNLENRRGDRIAVLSTGTLNEELRMGMGKFVVSPDLVKSHEREEDDHGRLMEKPLRQMGRLKLSEAFRRELADYGNEYGVWSDQTTVMKETRVRFRPNTGKYVPTTGALNFYFDKSGREDHWTWSSPQDLQMEKDMPAFAQIHAQHKDDHRMDVFRQPSQILF